VNGRRLATYAVLAVLLAGAGFAAWRSTAARPDPAHSIAAGLLCPACQGESVAQSQSPMAAAMRDTIAQQLAAGRSPAQIRQYFVDRYGPGIRTDPPRGGLGLVLWLVPLAVLALLTYLAWQTRRHRAAPGVAAGPRAPSGAAGPPASPGVGGPPAPSGVAGPRASPGVGGPPAPSGDAGGPLAPRRSARVWGAVAVGVVALVAVVAFGSPRQHDTPSAAATPDATATLLSLGRSLESQGRYAEAAQVYRDAVQHSPDDSTRLRLAFALLRSGRAAEAADTAQQVLDDDPGDTEALLMLGLAQRATGSPAAAATLRRFLRSAPDDPAAAEVRRLLAAK
jgi:cytochrome c-type biogenesis protein CcmH/NrfF